MPNNRVNFVQILNFDNVIIAMTLKNLSRSNGWYGTNVFVGINIWHNEKKVIVESLIIIS